MLQLCIDQHAGLRAVECTALPKTSQKTLTPLYCEILVKIVGHGKNSKASAVQVRNGMTFAQSIPGV